jgi:crotonobetainyl-CoA:carnitine CoA-transferase CaiB-like acyl-CoA transferase
LSRYPQPEKLKHTPDSGEHTYEVLAALGYDKAAVDGLRAKGVV